VIAVLGGLGAAACWSCGTLCAARASRLVGAQAVLAWVMLVGFAVVAPPAAVNGVPGALHGRLVVWFALSGAGNVGGLLFAYDAMRLGKVSIVAPITSTEGAIAAVVAVAAGESLRLASGIVLAAVAGGVVLASRTPGDDRDHPARATALAVSAAGMFGISLYATAKVSAALPLVWALVPPRLVGMAAVTLPILARGRLRIASAAAPFVVVSGLCEVAGFASYAEGSRHGIAVAAVLASQFATLTAVAAFVLFRERLGRVQLVGVAVVAVGVATLSALQA
jgi:drug/metabolite transporter (DMT)-like permease